MRKENCPLPTSLFICVFLLHISLQLIFLTCFMMWKCSCDEDKGESGPEKGAAQETLTWEPHPDPAADWGVVIESHCGGVNPHSPRPSLCPAGHKKALLPSPTSPRWPLTSHLWPSLASFCRYAVIISNICSFQFARWVLSQPTKHS